MKYRITDMLDQLILHEGLRLDVYKDTLGIPTVGIGRNLRDRGITSQEMNKLGFTSELDIWEFGLTREQAMYLARNDIEAVEKEVMQNHPCIEALDEVRQRVIIDMAFNLGVPRLLLFKNMWAAIHDKDYNKAADEMLDSKWATQVGQRAIRLSNAMRSGKWLVI